MLIVVEGPEGAGKTTWCRQFMDEWPHASVLVHHTTGKLVDGAYVNGSSNSEVISQELVALSRLPEEWAILFDRWFYSDYVYKPLSGLPLEMDMDLQSAEENFGRAIDLRLILMPDIETLRSRAAPDDSGIDKQLEVNAYNNLYPDWARNLEVKTVSDSLLELMGAQKVARDAALAAEAARAAHLERLAATGKPVAAT